MEHTRPDCSVQRCGPPITMTTPRKPTAKRASSMRKAFVRRFGGDDKHGWADIDPLWLAWQAGAAWQRRQRRSKA